MNILIATGVRRVREAGAASVAFHHADELEKLGHKVELWFMDDLLPKPRWPARFATLEFATAVSKRIKQDPSRFDVANIHAPWGCVYGVARKWSSRSDLPPYVFTMQGSEERYALAMRFEHQKGRATNFAWKNRVWHRLYHQRLYDYSVATANFGAVAAREGWTLSELKYSHPSGRIWFVPNGTDEEFFLPRTFSESAAPNKLLFVGTWLDRKGIYYLVDAFSALASELPAATLTVAGCVVGDPEVKADFPSAIRDRVTVIPQLSRGEMPQLYTSHDLFVFPSLVEGMPLSLLEAMATAMPVVTTTACGMADVVENEYNGLLVPAADAPALTAAIRRYFTEPVLRQRLGRVAQETARRYTWKNIAVQMEHIFKLAAQSRTAP